jgi:AcrR family transcriptional regulator
MPRIIDNPDRLILGQAKEILYREGYVALNMRRLAKDCQIALGTIYNYYPTKNDLILAMMLEYWQDFFTRLEPIAARPIPLDQKLQEIFEELRQGITHFKTFWLRPELYDLPDTVESGVKKEAIYIERLIAFVAIILRKELPQANLRKEDASALVPGLAARPGPAEMAEFIVLNFMTMIQMPIFKYESFARILKQIIA